MEGPDGNWYFFTHHGSGDWSGRIASLLPVEWVDGWPMIGDRTTGDIGSMVWQGMMPATGKERLTIARSDDFDHAVLSPQWQWNYQPRSEMFSLTERPGWMRMYAFRPLEPNNLFKAGNTLTQRTWRTPSNCVTVKIDLTHMADGQHAGLCHFSAESSGLGIVQEEGVRYIEQHINGHYMKGERIVHPYVWLQTQWGLDGMATYSKIASAQGDAKAQILAAEAEAQSIKAKSIEVARALGFKIIQTETVEDDIITVTYDIDFTGKTAEEISVITEYLKYIEYLDKWDGKLPSVMVGDENAQIIVPAPTE